MKITRVLWGFEYVMETRRRPWENKHGATVVYSILSYPNWLTHTLTHNLAPWFVKVEMNYFWSEKINYDNMEAWKATTDAKYGVGKSSIYRSIDLINRFQFNWWFHSVLLILSSCLYLVVVYNFDGNVTHGLRLTIGETVHIFEECSGESWL